MILWKNKYNYKKDLKIKCKIFNNKEKENFNNYITIVQIKLKIS